MKYEIIAEHDKPVCGGTKNTAYVNVWCLKTQWWRLISMTLDSYQNGV